MPPETTDDPAALPLTGERTVPGVAEENYWFRRHEAAYLAMLPHCAGRTVLEAGCGEGYGADLLAEVAELVVGLDYDALAARHVARSYPRVAMARANLVALPVRSAAIDVVVTMQVLEHLWDQSGFLDECRRVIRPGGKLVLSTPNRLTFSPGRDTPLNPFHTKELSPSELDEMLGEAGFLVNCLGGLHHGPGLRDLDVALGGSLVDAQVAVAMSGQPWPAELLAAVTAVTSTDFAMTTENLDACLDLVAVAVRP